MHGQQNIKISLYRFKILQNYITAQERQFNRIIVVFQFSLNRSALLSDV